MKKLFAIILTVALLLSLSVPTFAAESQTSTITVVMKDSGGDGWGEGTFGFPVCGSAERACRGRRR